MKSNKINKNFQKAGEGGIASGLAILLVILTSKLLHDNQYNAQLTVAYTAVILGLYNFIRHSIPVKKAAN